MSLDCIGNGWGLDPRQDGQPRQIFWVIRDNVIASGQSNDGRCRDEGFIEANISINGVINAERNPGNNPSNIYTYFTTQYRGSIGNETGYPDNVPPTIRVYENPNDPNDPDNGTNMLWMQRECWLNGDSYRTVLASGDQQRIFGWHRNYLECRATYWQSGAQQENYLDETRFALYQAVYGGSAGQNGLIDAAISNFMINCVGPNSISDVSDPAYFECDPSNGAFSRVFANNDGNTSAYEFSVETCTGANLQAALTNAQAEMGVDYRDLMSAIGSPDFGGTPGNYTPAYSAILQPVLRLEIRPDESVNGCRWFSNSYVQAANAFHYPR